MWGDRQECTGLGEGGVRLAAAAFDVQQPVHVFGATLDGRLLQLTLGNPKTFLHCRVGPPLLPSEPVGASDPHPVAWIDTPEL